MHVVYQVMHGLRERYAKALAPQPTVQARFPIRWLIHHQYWAQTAPVMPCALELQMHECISASMQRCIDAQMPKGIAALMQNA